MRVMGCGKGQVVLRLFNIADPTSLVFCMHSRLGGRRILGAMSVYFMTTARRVDPEYARPRGRIPSD